MKVKYLKPITSLIVLILVVIIAAHIHTNQQSQQYIPAGADFPLNANRDNSADSLMQAPQTNLQGTAQAGSGTSSTAQSTTPSQTNTSPTQPIPTNNYKYPPCSYCELSPHRMCPMIASPYPCTPCGGGIYKSDATYCLVE